MLLAMTWEARLVRVTWDAFRNESAVLLRRPRGIIFHLHNVQVADHGNGFRFVTDKGMKSVADTLVSTQVMQVFFTHDFDTACRTYAKSDGVKTAFWSQVFCLLVALLACWLTWYAWWKFGALVSKLTCTFYVKAAYDIRAKRAKIWASNTWLYASSGIHMGNFDRNHGMRGPFLGALIHLSECTVLVTKYIRVTVVAMYKFSVRINTICGC